jgi:hypothetical protein
MVPLTPVPSEFAGRVLVAKLGSAGILAELRGISQVYPAMFGRPEVWVEADVESEARELITAETDDVLDAPPGTAPRSPLSGTARVVLAAIVLVLIVGVTLGGRGCSVATNQSTAHTH